MYKYEMHLHTSPVSLCARATVKETVNFYKSEGYDGIFITNHFLDGNISIDSSKPFEEKMNFYFSDYEVAEKLGREIGIKVFPGVEISYSGTDFLIYGLSKQWFLNNPQLLEKKMSDKLTYLKENGAFIIQAHPYREAAYIDHIRLFPRHIDGVETINACRNELENKMASLYAKNYGLLEIAGSDNHIAGQAARLAGIETVEPINSVEDFINFVKCGKTQNFCVDNKKG